MSGLPDGRSVSVGIISLGCPEKGGFGLSFTAALSLQRILLQRGQPGARLLPAS